MAKKSTLICIHVMPSELEMFEQLMIQFHKAFRHLNETDDVTLKVSLNLNPKLTNWEESELNQSFFLSRFAVLFNGLKNVNEVILNDSLWGTTQQKRDSIKLNYDQFIFCDTDILFHEHLLRHQLDVSYQLDGMYLISPSLPKWWDDSWDILCHSDYLDKPYGYATDSDEVFNNTFTQEIKQITAKQMPFVKFGCGMHTLYLKSFWEFVGIPEEFGGYGPEDTFGMTAANLAKDKGYKIDQYVLDGIYITENYKKRNPSFYDKLVTINKKDEFYSEAESKGAACLQSFIKKI